ncbi:sugar transferase [Aliiroseovarius sp. YM-037]|uniref:sugar transferase n=1 Tax=Aliiroseovarius sp. YM-037 TaxID=3341728 RepID=UPI003A7F9F47
MSSLDSGSTIAFDRKPIAYPVKNRRVAVGGRVKRLLDISLAALGLIVLLPLFALVALAVKLTSSGPVLYGHSRIGFRGRTFRCWKFRSMVSNGDEVLEAHFKSHPEDRREWEVNRKLREDPRVTKLGAVLRAYSVDELPQLLNVLRGDMSFVGPRPVVRDELENYGTDAMHYLNTRPGITGLWQISGRSDVDYDQRVALDSSYVRNWSFGTDCLIILKTVPAVVAARGSY